MTEHRENLRKYFWGFVTIAIGILGTGCAQGPKLSANDYREILQPREAIPLKAKFDLTFQTAENLDQLSAVLFYKDSSLWRIELSALLGIHVASVLKNQEGVQIYVPSEELLLVGKSEMLKLPGAQGELVPLGLLLNWLQGIYSDIQDLDSLRFSGDSLSYEQTLNHEHWSVLHYNPVKYENQWAFFDHQVKSDRIKVSLHLTAKEKYNDFKTALWQLKYPMESIRIIYLME